MFKIRLWGNRTKYYGHIQSLGYNCETAYNFFLDYKFVESGVFVWANSGCIDNVINVIKHPEFLMSGDIEIRYDGWYDCNSNIWFHRKAKIDGDINTAKNQKILAQDKEDLISRTVYLRQKFKNISADGKKNLYIYKESWNDLYSAAEMQSRILELHHTLTGFVQNNFDLLVVLKKTTCPGIEKDLREIKNLYIRRLKFFAPENNITGRASDRASWKRIFKEFVPDFHIERTKKFKFEKDGE